MRYWGMVSPSSSTSVTLLLIIRYCMCIIVRSHHIYVCALYLTCIPYVGKFWTGKILANESWFAKFYPPNILLNKYRMANRQLFTIQIFCANFGIFYYWSIYYNADKEEATATLPDPNGRLGKKISGFVLDNLSEHNGKYDILEPWLAQKTRIPSSNLFS